MVHWEKHLICNATTKSFSKKTEEECKVRMKCYRAIKQTFIWILGNQKQTTVPLSSHYHYKQLSVPIDCCTNFKFLALSRPDECNKKRYWTHQFEWRNNRSCLHNDCNNNCNNDSSPRNCNYERAKLSARQFQSNSNSTQDKKPKHSASRQESGYLCHSEKSLAVFLLEIIQQIWYQVFCCLMMLNA